MITPKTSNINYFPHEAKTRNDVAFDPNKDIWKIKYNGGNIFINFSKLPIYKENLFGLKKVFKWYLENHSTSYSQNIHKYLQYLFNFTFENTRQEIKEISDVDLVNYKSSLSERNIYYLGYIVGFLKKWFEMGYPGISPKAYKYLNEVRLKGNIKGESVLTMCPLEGPFTPLELDLIQDKIDNSYAQNIISIQDYILVWLFMIYGSRPIQISQLKLKDVIEVKNEDGSFDLIINIPRAKNRKKSRSEFKRRIVPSSFSKVLLEYCNQQKNKFKDIPNFSQNAPLFFDETIKNLNQISNKNSNELEYHLNSYDINYKLRKIFDNLHIISNRTSKKLNITPIRFRRTLGTRAASEGHGELIVAEILDHTDTQNAGVYVSATPEIIETINKAIALEMAPISQAFQGKLVKNKSKAIRANDPHADIVDPSLSDNYAANGKCGSFSFCELFTPIACYTCSDFQAWTDGPHEALLARMIQERDKLMKTAGYTIASINDKTILAIAQVVSECRKYNNEPTKDKEGANE